MTITKKLETRWYPEKQLIATNLSGMLTMDDILCWEISLFNVFHALPDNTRFKIFINMFGFTAKDFEAHKRFRTIIPTVLANYGWKVGYVQLFPEQAEKILLSNDRGIQCIAAAHCHDDATKMSLYHRAYSWDYEQFFTDEEQAYLWLEQLTPNDEPHESVL